MTHQNPTEPKTTTEHTMSTARSVTSASRRVRSMPSTSNGSVHVTNVAAAPAAMIVTVNAVVGIDASRQIDQRIPIAIGPPSGTPLLTAVPTSWTVAAVPKVEP